METSLNFSAKYIASRKFLNSFQMLEKYAPLNYDLDEKTSFTSEFVKADGTIIPGPDLPIPLYEHTMLNTG